MNGTTLIRCLAFSLMFLLGAGWPHFAYAAEQSATEPEVKLSTAQNETLDRLEDQAAESQYQILKAKAGTEGGDQPPEILTRTQMGILLEEIKYQLTYAEDACASSKQGCKSLIDLILHAREYIEVLEKHPYLLSVNLGFFDNMRRTHSILMLFASRDSGTFFPLASRLTPLVDKEAHHLFSLSAIYQSVMWDHVVDVMDLDSENTKAKGAVRRVHP